MAPRPESIVKQFRHLIPLLEGGDTNEHISLLMSELVSELTERAVGNGRKHKGELILRLKFVAEGDGMTVTPEATVKLDKIPRGPSYFWSDSSGALLLEHPGQISAFDYDRPLADRHTAPPVKDDPVIEDAEEVAPPTDDAPASEPLPDPDEAKVFKINVPTK